MTGRSTSGSSRTSTPKKAARPATTISVLRTKARTGRRTNSAVEPFSSPPLCSSVMPPAPAHEPLPAAGGVGGCGSRRAGDQQFGAFAHHMDAFGHDLVARRQVGVDQHGLGIALDDAHRRAPGLAVADRPDEGAVRAPLDRQRIDRRVGVAGKAHRDLERHAGAQRVVGIVDAGLNQQRAALLVEAVVDGADRAVEGPARTRDRRGLKLLADRDWRRQSVPAPRNRRRWRSGRRWWRWSVCWVT